MMMHIACMAWPRMDIYTVWVNLDTFEQLSSYSIACMELASMSGSRTKRYLILLTGEMCEKYSNHSTQSLPVQMK